MAINDYDSGKASAVKFFMVLSCVASVVGGISSIARENLIGGIILLVSLVWTIPMTVYTFRCLNAHQYIDTGFKICTLFLNNLIAGIILLCMKTEGENKEDTGNVTTQTTQTASYTVPSGNATTTTPASPTTQSATQRTAPQNTTSTQRTAPATNNAGNSHTTSEPGGGTSPYNTNTLSNRTPDDFHHWTYRENEICVKMVFYNFVYHHYHNVSEVVDDIYKYLNCAIKPSSIHMKLSNIKYLLNEEQIQNTLPVKPLSQASDACKKAFERVYDKYIEDGEYIEYPLKENVVVNPLPQPPTGGKGDKSSGLPTYKIKVTINGKTYFYRHNIHDNTNNLIYPKYAYLLATALLPTESKIMAEQLKKQYPTATIEIVENVSDKYM